MRPIKHLIIGLGALITILGFVVGVPSALGSYVGWPLPTTIPTLDQIELGLRGGIDPQLIIKTLAVIVWIVWAQLVVVVTAECVAVAKGRSTRRLPVLPGLQPAVAHLVAAVTLAVATLGPLRTPPALAGPIPVAAASSPQQQVAAAEQGDVTEDAELAAEQTAKAGPTYRVARHDTLWRVAEMTLGDGRRWREIRDLNAGRTMVDGRPFTATTETIAQGWMLLLPGDAILPDQASDSDRVVTVEPGDNFWTIATDTLAEAWDRPPANREVATYWPALVDSNRHRLAPPHDPDLIYPGQIFELPTIPTDPTAVETASGTAETPTATENSQVVVEPGDSFWRIAERTLADAWGHSPTSAETTAYWEGVVDANRRRLKPPHDPDLIHPGQVFILPPIPAGPNGPAAADTAPADPPAPATSDRPPETPTTTAPPPPTATAQATPTTVGPPTSQDQAETPSSVPTETDLPESDDSEASGGLLGISSRLAGLAVLAAGLVALLRRLRGAQLRHRRPGTIPAPPSPESAPVEAMIHTAAAPTVTELIDLTLRAMARHIVEAHTTPPDVVGVHVTTDTLRLLLWTPHTDPPTGWKVEDEGRSWTTPTAVDVDRLAVRAQRVPAPYPALVTIGHGDHTQLLLNLEHLGATQITGTPDDVVATCYTMATELATSPLADDLQVICVGFGTDLAQLERVRTVDDVNDVLAGVHAKTTAVERSAAGSTLEGRMSPANSGTWDPIVVIDPTATATDETNRLVAVAHTGKTVAALVGYPTGERWRLHVQDDTIRVEPLGYTFARRNLTPQEQTAVTDLVAAAIDLDGIPADLAVDPLPHEDADRSDPDESAIEPTLFDGDREGPTLKSGVTPEIKLLGTVRVEGVERRFPLRRCTELIAYLALHRGGVEADTLMEALWPEEPPDYQRLNRHTSRARVTLGAGPDGEPYVPYITDGIYRISPHLRSDIERFTSLIRQTDKTASADAAEQLRAALHLVEGTPFTGAGNGYSWAHTQGIITHTIVAIDNVAHRLADHALAAGDPAETTWAARKGLLATGACEQCYRNLMRAALTEGNHVAFEATYQELLAVTDADDGPDAISYLEPETIDLYERATRRRRRQAG